jgi:hypothetical protein
LRLRTTLEGTSAVDRRKTPYPTAFLPPDLQVPDLEALADRFTAS